MNFRFLLQFLGLGSAAATMFLAPTTRFAGGLVTLDANFEVGTLPVKGAWSYWLSGGKDDYLVTSTDPSGLVAYMEARQSDSRQLAELLRKGSGPYADTIVRWGVARNVKVYGPDQTMLFTEEEKEHEHVYVACGHLLSGQDKADTTTMEQD